MRKFFHFFIALFMWATVCAPDLYAQIKEDEPVIKVLIETNMGDITLALQPQRAPITVGNFIRYVKEGFYNETLFHRVIPGFMIQGGGFDLSGSLKPTREAIQNESNPLMMNRRGTVAMARTQAPHSATAQFFINVADNPHLDSGRGVLGYAVFGYVISGMQVVDTISKVQTDYRDCPVQDLIIRKVQLLDDL